MKNLKIGVILMFLAALAAAQPLMPQIMAYIDTGKAAGTAHAQPTDEEPSGYWEGSLRYRGAAQTMSMEISLNAGVWTVTADIPDVGILSQSLGQVAVDGHHIQFQLPLGRGLYKGEFHDAAIVGNTGNRWDDEFVVTAVFRRKDRPNPPYIRRELSFRNGEVSLVGTLFLPKSPGPHPAVVAVQGATERTRDNPDYSLLSYVLPPNGIAVLLYDGRGAGRSTGNFETATFSDLAGDALAGVRELAQAPEIDSDRIGLWGISQGAWVLPQAATLSKSLAFLIIVSGMADTAAHQMDYLTTVSLKKFGFSQEAVRDMLMARHAVNEYFRGHLPRDAAERIVQSARSQPWFPLAYVPSVLPEDVSKTKWITQMDFNPAPLWKEVTVPVLILYGEDDDQVPSAAEAALLKTDLEKAGNRSIAVKGFPRTSHELLVVSHDDQPWEWRHVPPEYPAVLVNWILKGRLP